MIKQYLIKILEGEKLSNNELKFIFEKILNKEIPEIQIAAFLTSLSMRGESVDEITILAKILREKSIKITAPHNAIDVCGTGGDNLNNLNISTAVAFVVSAANIPVAKHGNIAVSSKSGSANVLTELGVNIFMPIKKAEEILHDINITFLMAPNYHPIMKNVAHIRKSLQIRTIFNILGPLLNPANVQYQLLGVFNKSLLNKLAIVLKNLGCNSACIVHGNDGSDEISITDKTYLAELRDNKIIEYVIHPHDFGLKCYNISDLEGKDAKYNAKKLLNLLNGEKGAYRDAVIINAAFALYVANKEHSIENYIDQVQEIIDNGSALNKLNLLIDRSNA